MKKNFGTLILSTYKCCAVNPVCNATSCYDCIWFRKYEKEDNLARWYMPWSRKVEAEKT